MLEDLRKLQLLDRPGAVPRHSNLATALLAIILEKVYGQTYENLLAKYVKQPLAMDSGTGHFNPTTLAWDTTNGMYRRRLLMRGRSYLPAVSVTVQQTWLDFSMLS